MTNAKESANRLAQLAFGITLTEAHRQLVCIRCRQPIIAALTSTNDYKEYRLSGLCPDCFDNLFPPEED